MSDSVAPRPEALGPTGKLGALGFKCLGAGTPLAFLTSSRYSPVALAVIVVAAISFAERLIRTLRPELGKQVLACVERIKCRA